MKTPLTHKFIQCFDNTQLAICSYTRRVCEDSYVLNSKIGWNPAPKISDKSWCQICSIYRLSSHWYRYYLGAVDCSKYSLFIFSITNLDPSLTKTWENLIMGNLGRIPMLSTTSELAHPAQGDSLCEKTHITEMWCGRRSCSISEIKSPQYLLNSHLYCCFK